MQFEFGLQIIPNILSTSDATILIIQIVCFDLHV